MRREPIVARQARIRPWRRKGAFAVNSTSMTIGPPSAKTARSGRCRWGLPVAAATLPVRGGRPDQGPYNQWGALACKIYAHLTARAPFDPTQVESGAIGATPLGSA